MRARTFLTAMIATLALGACASPRPMVPTTTEGPVSYVCFVSGVTQTMDEVKAVATSQCARYGMPVKRFLGTSFAPMKCGLLTPEVAAYACGNAGYSQDFRPR